MPSEQLLNAACREYPYPLARAVRSFQTAHDVRDRYDAALRMGESTVTLLGCLGLAQVKGDLAIGVEDWHESLGRGGVSLGHWLGAARDAAASLRATGYDPYGFGEAVRPRKGGRGLLDACNRVVQIRNTHAHSGAPRSGAELRERLETLEESLTVILEEAVFLEDTWIVLPLSSTVRRGAPVFDNTALDITGNHPDFDTVEFETDQALPVGTLFALPRGSLDVTTDLTPFLVARDCDRCLTREIYFPDRITSDGLRLKSFDRGHQLVETGLEAELQVPGHSEGVGSPIRMAVHTAAGDADPGRRDESTAEASGVAGKAENDVMRPTESRPLQRSSPHNTAPPQPPPAPVVSPPTFTGTTDRDRRSGTPLRRLAARGLDLTVMFFTIIPLIFLTAPVSWIAGDETGGSIGGALWALTMLVYEPACMRIWGRTLGKTILDLSIESSGNRTAKDWNVIIRRYGALLATLAAFPLLIVSVVIMWTDAGHRAIHDRAAGTRVDRTTPK